MPRPRKRRSHRTHTFREGERLIEVEIAVRQRTVVKPGEANATFQDVAGHNVFLSSAVSQNNVKPRRTMYFAGYLSGTQREELAINLKRLIVDYVREEDTGDE